jgi:hypothetical protein
MASGGAHRANSLVARLTTKTGSESINLSIEAFQHGPEFIHPNTENVILAGTIKDNTHGVTGKVGYASRTSDHAEPLESYVLFFGQTNTDGS